MTRHSSLWLPAASVAALAWLLAARIVGPSDAFDQTQPRTISYTTDMIVNGRWVLPVERGEVLATKPPLYNWLAVPAVALLGFSSEIGHKLPSVLALLGCFLILVRVGERLGDGAGWLAALVFVANYTIFKLGYLARPDMLLTLLLLLGWVAATELLARRETGPRRALQLGFWGAVALALLTKGPAALVLPLYAIVAAPALGGRPGAAWRLGWWWGLPLSLAPFALWLLLVHRAAPDHLVQQLWFEEFYGRVTGLGGEGTGEGPIELLKGAGYMPAYFLVRFAPWSIVCIAGMLVLWAGRRREEGGPARPWLVAAAIYALLTVILFSMSAGKRADYMAGALAPASLLAGWMIARSRHAAWRVIAVAAAVAVLATSTVVNQMQLGSPVRGLGPVVQRFVADVEPHLRREPLTVCFWTAGTSQLQAMLGYSMVDGVLPVRDVLLAADGPCWVIAGERPDDPRTLEEWLDRLARRGRHRFDVELVVSSERFPWTDMWPEEVRLYRVTPSGSAGSAP